MKAFPKLLLGLLFFSLPGRGAVSFLAPSFEKLDRSVLEPRFAALERNPSPTSEELVEKALTAFFLAEADTVAGHPHGARAWLDRAESVCNDWESDGFQRVGESERARAGYLCAATRAEQLAGGSPLSLWGRAGRLQDDLALGQLGKLEPEERWYAEGRIFLALPPGLGQSFKTGLMALSFLERARSDLTSVLYWLGRGHELRGNRERAADYFRQALAAGDARARLAFPSGEVTLSPDDLDGVRYGWAPALFCSPSQGVGARLSLFDDRLFDTSRAGSLELEGASRDFWRVAGSLSDRASLPPARLELEAEYRAGIEDFFGLGIHAPIDNHASLKMTRASLEVSVERPLGGPVALRVGWRELDARLHGSSGGDFESEAIDDKSGITLGNPFGELRLDSRDSRFDPRQGYLLRVRGDFPTSGMGSPRGYQLWRAEAHGYWELVPGQVLALGAGYAGLVGAAPYPDYPRLGGTFALPGVRAGRFQDRNVLAEVAEYRAHLWGALSALGFVLGGTASSSQVLSSPHALGYGAGIQYQVSRYRAPLLRVELGKFGDETVLQASATALW